MDELVLAGAAGIAALFLAVVLLLYGAYAVAAGIYAAVVSGDYHTVILFLGVLLSIGFLYLATGIWLRKTDRI
jgi:hypothetical protein